MFSFIFFLGVFFFGGGGGFLDLGTAPSGDRNSPPPVTPLLSVVIQTKNIINRYLLNQCLGHPW